MLVFNIVSGLIMLVAFIGMIICAKKQHASQFAKPGAIGLLIVVVLCSFVVLHKNMGSGEGETLREYEMKYTRSLTYAIGKELASQMPGSSVLVIVGEGNIDDPDSRLKIMIDGLKEGFGNDITDLTIEKPKVTQPKGSGLEEFSLPIEDLVSAKDINTLLTKNKDCKIVISFIGLPQDAGGLKLWADFNRNPRTCQKLVMIHGDTAMLAKFINIGLIPAMVTHSPDAQYKETAPPSSLEDCFDQRYLLITKNNIKELAQKYPKIFNIK